jgi:hypothetical protein
MRNFVKRATVAAVVGSCAVASATEKVCAELMGGFLAHVSGHLEEGVNAEVLKARAEGQRLTDTLIALRLERIKRLYQIELDSEKNPVPSGSDRQVPERQAQLSQETEVLEPILKPAIMAALGYLSRIEEILKGSEVAYVSYENGVRKSSDEKTLKFKSRLTQFEHDVTRFILDVPGIRAALMHQPFAIRRIDLARLVAILNSVSQIHGAVQDRAYFGNLYGHKSLVEIAYVLKKDLDEALNVNGRLEAFSFLYKAYQLIIHRSLWLIPIAPGFSLSESQKEALESLGVYTSYLDGRIDRARDWPPTRFVDYRRVPALENGWMKLTRENGVAGIKLNTDSPK